MATGHPCRMRVSSIRVEHLPKVEISFKPE